MDILAGLLHILLVTFVLFLVLGMYFLPSFIAFSRNHRNKVGILVLNIFLGWTFLGWVAALVWSLSN